MLLGLSAKEHVIHLCLFGKRPNGVGCFAVAAGVNKLSFIELSFR